MTESVPYLVAATIAAFAGGFRGFAGFGSGLFMVPLMSILFPPQIVVPVAVLLTIAGDIRLLPEVHTQVDRRRLASLALPALVALPVGVTLLSVLAGSDVRRIVSAAVLVLVMLMFFGIRIPYADRVGVMIPLGAISGVLTGVGGVGGPPVVLGMLSIDEPAAKTRANLIAYFFVTGIVAFAMILGSGTGALRDVLPLAAVCLPPYLVTLHAGSRMFSRGEQRAYRTIALVFLGFVAVLGLLWPGG